MHVKSRQKNAALVFAVAAAVGLGSYASHSRADTYTTSTSTETNIEPAGPYSGGTSYFDFYQAGSYPAFGVLDFSSAALGIASGYDVSAVNSDATLTLGDYTNQYNAASTFAVYLSTNSGSLSGLTYQAASAPQGIGTQLDTLYALGNITYTPGSNGTFTVTPLTLSGAAETYLANQINSGGNIRIVLAPTSSTDNVYFAGPGAGAAAPALSLDLTTAAIGASNSILTVNGGVKTQTVDLGRIVYNVNANTTITLTNSGPDSGVYSVIAGAAGACQTLTAAGIAATGVEPVPGSGGTSTVTVGMLASNVLPGTASPDTPATATITIHNQTNASDPDNVVTVQADQVVAARLIDNVGSTNNVVQFGKVLGGTASAPQSVTLDTENTNSYNLTSDSLTSVTLLGNTTLTAVPLLGVANTTLVTDAGSLAAGTSDTLFNDGSVTTARDVTFVAGNTVGGLYQSDGYYDGYLSIPLVNSDTALGATTTPTARVYMEADVYQQASVSGAPSGTQYLLTNAPHTPNVVNTTLGDIGARASAQVTSVALVAQAGFSIDPGLQQGTMIGDGDSIVGTNFDPTAKWNGVYNGTLTVGLENDQSITGATPGDLGTQNYAVTSTVAGNSGNASVNVLKGGSFAGYSIPRGAGKNSTVSLVGGTSTNGNTISVTWADGSSAYALSDQATLTRTANDLIVVQMSYDPTAITQSAAGSPVLSYVNGNGVNVLAALGNSDGGTSAAETIGAFSGTPTLGEYGIDPVNDTVWAVVDHVGTFEAFSRMLGDASGDGTVDLNDLNIVLNNLGTTSALWSKGNFDGAAMIDLNDLNDVLNHLGTSLPAGSVAQSLSGVHPNTPVAPEPATLSLAGLGAIGMLLRRGKRAAR